MKLRTEKKQIRLHRTQPRTRLEASVWRDSLKDAVEAANDLIEIRELEGWTVRDTSAQDSTDAEGGYNGTCFVIVFNLPVSYDPLDELSEIEHPAHCEE